MTEERDNHLEMSQESGSIDRDEAISSSSSDLTDPNDETWGDWVEDPTPCTSLFDDIELPSVSDALKHDMEKHGFDLNEFSKRLGESK